MLVHPRLMLPPPLPTEAQVDAPRVVARRVLGAAAVGIVLSGYFISGGALYALAGIGLALGTARLTGNIYLGLLLAFLLVPVVFGLALVSVVLSVSGAIVQMPSTVLARFTYLVFCVLAALCLIGLISADILQNLPGTAGIYVKMYYFLWPPLFAALSACYAILYTRFRIA